MSDQQQSFKDLKSAVDNICSTRLTSNRPIRRPSLPQRESIQPSGPRAPSEGIDEQEQGIAHVELLENGSVALYVTMLAAGFVIGSRGFSIRQICEQTKSYIRSETIKPGRFTRTTRLFEISGTQEACKQALGIIISAVDLYKKLTEGEMEGHRVEQIQYAANIAFMYQPPPHRMVPQAAQLVQSGSRFLTYPEQPVTPQPMVVRRNQSYPGFSSYVGSSVQGGFGGSGFGSGALQNSSLDEVLMTKMVASAQLEQYGQISDLGNTQNLDMAFQSIQPASYVSSAPTREVLGMLNTNSMEQRNRIVPIPSPGSSSTSWRQNISPGGGVQRVVGDQAIANYNREMQENINNNDEMENTVRNILHNLNLGNK